MPIRVGAGMRTLSIDDTKVIDGYTVRPQLGLEGTTRDATLGGGTGIRINVTGPVHLRVDLDVAMHFGTMPEYRGTHSYWEVSPSVTLDLRRGPTPDRDDDGVADKMDACRTVPEDRDGFQDDDGCPEPDNDSDGVPDEYDRCAQQAEDRDEYQDRDGCPEPNNDGDRYADIADSCPNERESENGWQDGDGCRDNLPAALLAIEMMTLPLGPNSGSLSPDVEAGLQRVAVALDAEPRARVLVVSYPADHGELAAVDSARLIAAWFAARGHQDRVGFWLTDVNWPLIRKTPSNVQAIQRPFVLFAAFDPVDADGKLVPTQEIAPGL